MRCIEIQQYKQYAFLLERLTLTWDVLKFSLFTFDLSRASGLTLTWDVLKCIHEGSLTFTKAPININMRCIEMHHPEWK